MADYERVVFRAVGTAVPSFFFLYLSNIQENVIQTNTFLQFIPGRLFVSLQRVFNPYDGKMLPLVDLYMIFS